MLNPTILWAQRDDYVWVTVDVANAEDLHVDLGSDSLKFECKADGKSYGFEIQFFKPIVKEDSKFLKHRLVDFCLKKAEAADWPSLISDLKKVSWIKVDWSKWQDSDAEDEPEGFDMSKMGGFGDFGMGAEMAGLGALQGEDSDDEDPDELPDIASEADQAAPKTNAPLIEEVNKAS